MKSFVSALVVLAAFAVTACGDDNEPAEPAGGGASVASADLVDTAAKAGSFKTLIAAVQAADLEETLRSPGPLTVFAPTDDAFAKLPAGTVDTLLKPENKEQLKAILTYHVVAGRVPASQAVTLTSAKTVNGKELTLAVEDGSLHVDNATVVQADVNASNGVIHVIDSVLLPE